MILETAQQFIDRRAGLSMWCKVCQRGVMVDLTKLPPETDLYSRPLPIKCKECGAKGDAISYSVHGPGSMIDGHYPKS